MNDKLSLSLLDTSYNILLDCQSKPNEPLIKIIHIFTVISFSSFNTNLLYETTSCSALTVNTSTQQHPLDEPEHLSIWSTQNKNSRKVAFVTLTWVNIFHRAETAGFGDLAVSSFFGVQWHWALTAAATRFGLLWRKIRLTCRWKDQSAAGWGGTEHLISNEKPEWQVYLSSVPQELSRRQWDSAGGKNNLLGIEITGLAGYVEPKVSFHRY